MLANTKISSYLNSRLAEGKAQKRISIKGRHVTEELNILKKITKINATTDLIKLIVLKINDDALVNKKKTLLSNLKV